MNKVTKNLKAIFALVLAAVLFALTLCAWPALIGTRSVASADGGSAPGPGDGSDPGDPNPNPNPNPDPQSPYSKLYYFSDDEDSEDYAYNVLPSFLSQVGLSASDMEYYYWQENFLKIFVSSDWRYVEDAYVIFEMRKTYPPQIEDEESLYVDDLNYIFDKWVNENGCKLMVIFGTDEDRLYGYTDFLTHAEIQVNTDVFYPFFWSMYDILEDMYDSIYYATNLLSPRLSDNWFGKPIYENMLFREFLIPEYRYLAKNSLLPLPAYWESNQDVWERFMNVNHNFWSWNEYYYMSYAIIKDRIDIMDLVAIGMTDWDEYAMWEDYIITLRDDSGREFPVFIYNDNEYPVADWVKKGTKHNVYYSGDIAAVLNNYLPRIMEDFILEKDLTQYGNWQSVSPICFKPLLPGKDGWIKAAGLRESTLLIMNADDAWYLGRGF